jgi:hypothetical protein
MVVKIDELIETSIEPLVFDQQEKLSDILEREWRQEDWCPYLLHNEKGQFCATGKLFDLAGSSWEQPTWAYDVRIPSVLIQNLERVSEYSSAFYAFLEQEYRLSQKQVFKLMLVNNSEGRDAVIGYLREIGR